MYIFINIQKIQKLKNCYRNEWIQLFKFELTLYNLTFIFRFMTKYLFKNKGIHVFYLKAGSLQHYKS